jgi:hypothetical protein
LEPDKGTFEKISLRALKKMILWLTKQRTNIAVIYDYIEWFIVRPITHSELSYIA